MSETSKKSYAFDLGNDVEGLKTSIKNHLYFTLARNEMIAEKRDWWISTCFAVRDRVIEQYLRTQVEYHEKNVRRVFYFSLEYLMGRLLGNNLYNTGLYEIAEKAYQELGLDFDEIREEEVDMGLGNGGLGRLAACFLDSLTTLNYPAIGYGIHYEFGLFKQEFVEGKQVEHPDNWLKGGTPWQIVRPEYSQAVPIYGELVNQYNDCGDAVSCWCNSKTILGVPWDIIIVGYDSSTMNFLRLWESRSSEEFDFQVFNEGGYIEAVREKAEGETISKVLYPNDKNEAGKELRLVQQYFFAACSLKDMRRRFKLNNIDWDSFPEKTVIQLNDTHPAIAIAELMRILVDEEGLEWERGWGICQRIFAYTNHTLLPEALEKWSVALLQKVLPRHLNIIYEINKHFLENEVERRFPGDEEKKRELSIIEEGPEKMVRMAYLSVIGSHSVNGVAAIHTQLLEEKLFRGFYELYPEKFNNKTNGITPRRWLQACNQGLSYLIDETIGKSWRKDLNVLREIERYSDDKGFQTAFMRVKQENKKRLAYMIKRLCNIEVDPNALFDVQIKRIHEYKRQHLNLLHILTLYYRLLHDATYDMHPRVFIFGGKAAPGYVVAKNMIYAINAVGSVINNDKRIGDKIKVVFIPNYGVTLAMNIIPAADLSEQISTAGTEASGTGNMKLALNGACTIGTMDGANIEIHEEVGEENIFIFGKRVDEVAALKLQGYDPMSIYENCDMLRGIIEWLKSGHFSAKEEGAFAPMINTFFQGGDPFMVFADYEAYCKKQEEVNAIYKNQDQWSKMAILNTARVGKFSSDRTIREYARDIWKLDPVKVSE